MESKWVNDWKNISESHLNLNSKVTGQGLDDRGLIPNRSGGTSTSLHHHTQNDSGIKFHVSSSLDCHVYYKDHL
jgi:hypothetical protein